MFFSGMDFTVLYFTRYRIMHFLSNSIVILNATKNLQIQSGCI